MTVQLYGLNKCGSCEKASAWLDLHKVSYTFTDYREQPLAPALLKAWASTLGWDKLVNRASFTWRDLTDVQKSAATEADWLALVKDYPALVKRPIVVAGSEVSAGFSEKKFAERFGG